jgi:hypothetical protein
MRTPVATFAMLVMAGFCHQANAQAACPELTRLRGEVVEASKPLTGIPRRGRCESYIRSSMAWHAIMQYANEHRESCDISSVALSEFETRHREAVNARDNVCTGRPLRPFPADVIQR